MDAQSVLNIFVFGEHDLFFFALYFEFLYLGLASGVRESCHLPCPLKYSSQPFQSLPTGRTLFTFLRREKSIADQPYCQLAA
jgi:hypothetical protein